MGVFRVLGTAVLVCLYGLYSGPAAAGDTSASSEDPEVVRAFDHVASQLLCNDLDSLQAQSLVAPALQSQRRKRAALNGEDGDENLFGSVIPLIGGNGAGGGTANSPSEDPGPPPILDPDTIPKVLVFEPRKRSAPEPRKRSAPEPSPSPSRMPSSIPAQIGPRL